MKPAIAFTLVGTTYGGSWSVMAITSEKPGRMVYGRDMDGMGTHRSASDVHGRFATEEAARAVIARIGATKAKHRAAIDAAQAALARCQRELRGEIEDILREASQ